MTHDHVTDFGDWVAARGDALAKTAYLLTGDTTSAEDLTQSALLRLYRRWDRLDHSTSLDAYVRQVLVHCWRSSWRRSLTRLTTLTADPPDRATRDEIADRALRLDLMRALSELPPRQRAAVVLRYFDDLTEAATAEALGCSVGTVKSQTARALEKLRHVMSEDRDAVTRSRT